MSSNLQASFGNIDIYLFDQLLKGTFDTCDDIIDVGCGGGRNVFYFLKNNFNVFGVDRDTSSVDSVRALARKLAPNLPESNFVVANAENIPFADATFDLAICSAVLHFADNKDHFEQMLHSIWRVLKPGGLFFARLASDIGIQHLVKPIENGRYLLPDGSVRYLVSYDDLTYYTQLLHGVLFEPIKTTNVSNLRAMTTWCLQKQ